MHNRKVLIRFGSGIALVTLLWLVRYYYTGSPIYIFLLWNLFLAFIPYCISQYMTSRFEIQKKQSGTHWKWWLLFAVWLLFFPNAPYVITDLIHLTERHGVPKWYDVSLLFCAGSTGLWIGYVSLLQMEVIWQQKIAVVKPNLFVAATFLLSGFGIYLGRVLRFNSWDIITDPLDLATAVASRVLLPWQHLQTWYVTFLFALLLWIGYWQVKTGVPSEQ